MRFIHPELREGEVLLYNVWPSNGENSSSHPETWAYFNRICCLSKRLGQQAYAGEGCISPYKKVLGRPVFISKEDLPPVVESITKQMLCLFQK